MRGCYNVLNIKKGYVCAVVPVKVCVMVTVRRGRTNKQDD